MSEDAFLASLARHAWLVDGPLAAIVDRYLAELRRKRYAARTVGAYLRSLAHFAYWLQSESLGLADVETSLVDRFLRFHLPACACPPPRKTSIADCRAALEHLLCLIAQDASGESAAQMMQLPVSAELARFHRYLADTCGLAANTCQYRLKHVGAFLARHDRVASIGTAELTSRDIEGFVADVAQRWKPASLGVIRNSMNSYLRFRTLAGDQTQALTAAIPRVANWTHTTLPKALSEAEIATFLASFNLADPSGLRDFAVARCLLDLDLRGQEVAHLHLNDLDWHSGTLVIGDSKGRRVHQLPLPAATGEAIARYLRYGRPCTCNRAVFVRHVAPFDKPLSVAGVRNIMTRAFARCGLADRFCNTHVLRHTAAVRLQRSGASLKEVADLLRHRNLDTTTVYARLDLERLRAVSLPWPGRLT